MQARHDGSHTKHAPKAALCSAPLAAGAAAPGCNALSCSAPICTPHALLSAHTAFLLLPSAPAHIYPIQAHTYVAIQVSVLGVVMDQAVTHLLDSFTAAAHAVLVVHPRAGDVHVSAPLGGAQLHLRVSPRGVASAAPQQEQPPAPARREAEGGARRSAQAAVVAAANGSQCASGPGGGRVSVQQSPSWGAAGLQAVVGPAGADCAGESRLGSDSAQPIQLRSEGSTSSSAISSAAASAAAGACPTPKQRFMQQAAAAAAAMAGDASGGALTAQMPTMVRRTSTAGSGGTSHCSTQVAELPARAHAAAAARAAGARSSAGGGRDECLEQLLIGSELLSLLS